MLVLEPTILFIDAYDSFSFNIVSLLERSLGVSVRMLKIDDPAIASDEALERELKLYAAVVCGPGPGNSRKEEDVGCMRRIWRLGEQHVLPVLGICLGFQSLCLEFGADVKRLKGPQHGMIRPITYIGKVKGGDSIFHEVGEIHATLYQSLHVDIGQDQIPAEVWEEKKWESPHTCLDLIPLAWVESNKTSYEYNASCGVKDARVLVAVQHRTKPFWALQYHPESACTKGQSSKVIKNWFKQAQLWSRCSSRRQVLNASSQSKTDTRSSLLAQSKISFEQPNVVAGPSLFNSLYVSRSMYLSDNISVPNIVQALGDVTGNQIILESTNADETDSDAPHVRGRYSIIGLDIDHCNIVEYRSGDSFATIVSRSEGKGVPSTVTVDIKTRQGIWPFLAKYVDERKIADGNLDSPFWGGFMGYITYEMGLQGMGVGADRGNSVRPDICLVWVTRSMVVDHVEKAIIVQQLQQPHEDEINNQWMAETVSKLEQLSKKHCEGTMSSYDAPSSFQGTIDLPGASDYEHKVRLCQSSIRDGDSYELCLTDQTHISFPVSPTTPSPWSIYKRLRLAQPSPYSSYIRLGPLSFLSCSPERFLHCSADGKCTLRPMKGTVKKSPAVSTLAEAKKLLDIPKERAENLMIVDLVRHDLSSVCGSAVEVKELMTVEEYKSIWQMSSVVEGQLPSDQGNGKAYSGLDVLAASLPPGSMTGAPKKRSCEILREIEGRERSLYSGVVGYMDVGGRGDWSVNIRCLYRWDDELAASGEESERQKQWHVGAGGAVTALSTPEGERDEMMTKLNGVLSVFR